MGKRGPKPKIDPQVFVNEYLNGKDTYELSKDYKLDQSVIRRHILSQGVKLRPRGTTVNKTAKLDYFSIENISKEAIYWVGFIIGDGNISNNRLSLYQSHDYGKYHLDKFREDLNITKEVNYKKQNGYEIALFGKDLIKDLNHYGVKENKSKIGGTLNIPAHYQNSFSLGLLDADGWVSLSNGRYCIGYCGHIDHLEFLNSYFDTHLDISLNIHKRKNYNNWTMVTSRKTYIKKLSEWLLDGCNYSLQRKRIKLINIAQGI